MVINVIKDEYKTTIYCLYRSFNYYSDHPGLLNNRNLFSSWSLVYTTWNHHYIAGFSITAITNLVTQDRAPSVYRGQVETAMLGSDVLGLMIYDQLLGYIYIYIFK